MRDRAMQALYLLSLDPLAETLADPNSYGFRTHRAPADAIEQCFTVLAKKASPQWLLEGDIRACFDEISHEWLLTHIPMEKVILRKWLKAGYMERNILHPTEAGTPQGVSAHPSLRIWSWTAWKPACGTPCHATSGRRHADLSKGQPYPPCR